MKDVLCSRGCGKMVSINDSSVGGVCGDCVVNAHMDFTETSDKSVKEKSVKVSGDKGVHTVVVENIISQAEIDKGMEKVMSTEVVDEPKTIKLSQVSKEHTVVEPKKESMRHIVLREFAGGKSRVEILGFLKLSYPDLADKKASALVSAYLSALKGSTLKKETSVVE